MGHSTISAGFRSRTQDLWGGTRKTTAVWGSLRGERSMRPLFYSCLIPGRTSGNSQLSPNFAAFSESNFLVNYLLCGKIF